MSLKFNRATGRWEDGTGDLDERYRRNNHNAVGLILLVISLMALFPEQCAKVLMTISLAFIGIMAVLWLFGFVK